MIRVLPSHRRIIEPKMARSVLIAVLLLGAVELYAEEQPELVEQSLNTLELESYLL